MARKIEINKDELYDLYINKNLSTYKIAEKYSCGSTTINNYLHKYKIPLRKRSSSGILNSRWKGYKEIPASCLSAIKCRANKKNIPFDIDLPYLWKLYLRQKKCCKLSGVKITFPLNVYKYDGTASLDRIDSSKGYIKGNVQWVHKHVNTMKMDLKQKDFIKYCKLIAENN